MQPLAVHMSPAPPEHAEPPSHAHVRLLPLSQLSPIALVHTSPIMSPHLHVPEMHTALASITHSAHEPPPVPQAATAVPVWHAPVESMHPVQHTSVAVQTPAPPMHVMPVRDVCTHIRLPLQVSVVQGLVSSQSELARHSTHIAGGPPKHWGVGLLQPASSVGSQA